MYLTRHSDSIQGIDLKTPIAIIGAGSIGSYACLALAKLGFSNILIADDGIVEEENIAPQFYRPRDIGKLKVDCLKRAIKDQTNTDILTIPARLSNENGNLYHIAENFICIMAVDSMSARKDLFEHLLFNHFIDARMAIEFLTIISFSVASDKFDCNNYRQSLFSDSDAVQEACTNKAISYTSFIAGALVAKCTVDLLKQIGTDTPYSTVNYDINNFDMMRLA